MLDDRDMQALAYVGVMAVMLVSIAVGAGVVAGVIRALRG